MRLTAKPAGVYRADLKPIIIGPNLFKTVSQLAPWPQTGEFIVKARMIKWEAQPVTQNIRNYEATVGWPSQSEAQW